MSILSEDQRKEFQALADPLIKYLNDNHHPHMKIIIDPSRAELLEGVCSHATDEHILD